MAVSINRRSMVMAIVLSLALALTGGLAAGVHDAYAASGPTISVKNAATGKLVLKKGAKYKLGAKATKGKLRYKSSKKSVATVSAKGVVKAVKPGKAKIVITAKYANVTKKKTIKVTVVAAKKYVKAKKIIATAAKSTLTAGQQTSIRVSFSPKKASDKNVLFKSSNPKVIAVNAAGKVTAKNPGKATVTITSCSNKKAKKKVSFTVTKKPSSSTSGNTPGGAESSALTAAKLRNLVSDGAVLVTSSESGNVESIDGAFTAKKVTNEAQAAEVLNDAAEVIGSGFKASAADIAKQSITTDGVTRNFFRYSPMIGNVPVEGSQVVLGASGAGDVQGMVSSYDGKLADIDATPTITQAEAEQTVLADLSSELFGEGDASVMAGLVELESRLIVSCAADEREPVLAYRIDASPSESAASGQVPGTAQADCGINNLYRTYYIYANDALGLAGEVATWIRTIGDAVANEEAQPDAQPRLQATPSTALSLQAVPAGFSDKNLSLSIQDLATGDYKTYNYTAQVDELRYIVKLRDDKRNIESSDFDYATYGWAYTPYTATDDDGNVWIGYRPDWPGQLEFAYNNANSNAVMSLSNMETVYDFYLNVLGRDSYNDNHAPIQICNNCCYDNVNNAYWCWGWQLFVFGARDDAAASTGVGNEFNAALDVVGHEFTHAVISFIVKDEKAGQYGFIYKGESGALSESYADIMGSLIEDKSGADRWLIAEDSVDAIRDMSNPTAFPNDIDHYSNYYPELDVHDASGVFNHAAYLMMTDWRTAGITRDQWAKLFYFSLNYLTCDATMSMAGSAVLQFAHHLAFTDDQIQAIDDALNSVGIVQRRGFDSLAPNDAVVFGGHRYKVYTDRMNWSDAKLECERKGGHLATITSQAEQDFVNDTLNKSKKRLWIGGYRYYDNIWRWVTNEPWSYAYWGKGEPNNSSNVIPDENRVSVWPRTWNDLNEHSREQSGYICEWDY